MCIAGLAQVAQVRDVQPQDGKAAQAFDAMLAQQRGDVFGAKATPEPQQAVKPQFMPFRPEDFVKPAEQTVQQPVPQPAATGAPSAPEMAATTAVPEAVEPSVDARTLEKTKMCKFFPMGLCKRGNNCTFAHSRRQLRPQPDLYRTQMCIDFLQNGSCDFGANCRYAHSEKELRPTDQTKPIKNSPAQRRGQRSSDTARQQQQQPKQQNQQQQLQQQMQHVQQLRQQQAQMQQQMQVQMPQAQSQQQSHKKQQQQSQAAAEALARELEEVRRQTATLQAQLEALRSTVGVAAPVPAVVVEVDAASSCGGKQSMGEESTQCPAMTAAASESSWGENAPSVAEEEEAAEFSVTVRNTFVELVFKSSPGAVRRTRSTPPVH